MTNPFCTTMSVHHEAFVNRKAELDQICDSVMRYGQSIAIIGEPRSGKTSLLKHLQDPEIKKNRFANQAGNIIFSFLDFRTFNSEITFQEFWERALEPCVTRMTLHDHNGFATSYRKLLESGFSSKHIEEVINQIHLAGYKLVILIDEFDTALSRPIPNRELFFGSMRSFSSTSKGSLIFIIAITCDIVALEELARLDNKLGSQYFNTYTTIQLGAFERNAINELVSVGKFNNDDVDFIQFIAGGHPYFIQSAASLLWDSYQTESIKTVQRKEVVSQKLSKAINPTLHFIWNRWSPEMKLAFTLVALSELPYMGKLKIHPDTLSEKIYELSNEIVSLKNMGYISESYNSNLGINGKIMMWFLLERIRGSLVKKDDLGEWLRSNGWDGFFTTKQKEELVELAKTGAKWFGESLVKGIGTILPELIKKSLGLA